MPKQIHCGFLVAIVTRLSKDERRRLNEQAAKEGVSANVLVRRRLGFGDGAVEEQKLDRPPGCCSDEQRGALSDEANHRGDHGATLSQTRALDAAQEATTTA